MWDMGDGMTWWMAIAAPLFVAAIIILAMWAVDVFQSDRRAATKPMTAIDAGRERYARGEISREQLQQITYDLRKAA